MISQLQTLFLNFNVKMMFFGSYRFAFELWLEACLEVHYELFKFVLFSIGVVLGELDVVPPVCRVESPVADPVLGRVGVTDKLLRAEEAAAFQALDAL